MTNQQPREYEYIGRPKQNWGSRKTPVQIKLRTPVYLALKELAEEEGERRGVKKYGMGLIVETWGMTDKRFVDKITKYESERIGQDEGGNKQKSE